MSGAIALLGFKSASVELFNRMRPQLELLQNIGGITVSGGEPLLQYQQVKELLTLCKKANIHTALETSASIDEKNVRSLLDVVDCWLFGLRPVYKKKNTVMADLKLVKRNLKLIASSKKNRIIIRTPLIPSYTDTKRSYSDISLLMQENNLEEIELLPFNPYSQVYYDAMGIDYPMKKLQEQSVKQVEQAQRYFENKGIKVKKL
jgi:pyruvate formate lyase activating enzyme